MPTFPLHTLVVSLSLSLSLIYFPSLTLFFFVSLFLFCSLSPSLSLSLIKFTVSLLSGSHIPKQTLNIRRKQIAELDGVVHIGNNQFVSTQNLLILYIWAAERLLGIPFQMPDLMKATLGKKNVWVSSVKPVISASRCEPP